MESQPEHCKEELELLKVLKELQAILTTALNSLANQKPPSMESRYYVYAAKAVNFASDAYIYLREVGKIHASKMMVRPMIEIVIKSIAVEKKKGLLSSIAYAEIQEMKKMYPKTSANEAAAKAMEKDLRERFEKDPTYPIDFKVYDSRKIAEDVGLVQLYDTAYRIYCKFTHSAVAALAGHYDEITDAIDTSSVLWAVLVMVNQLKLFTPAVLPDLFPFNEKVELAQKAMDEAWNRKT